MADGGQNLLGKLADAGEEAIQKVGEMPGLTRVTQAVAPLRERMDDLQKRVRGLEDVERRLAALEKRVDELAAAKATRSSAATRRTPATRKPSSAPKKSSSS